MRRETGIPVDVFKVPKPVAPGLRHLAKPGQGHDSNRQYRQKRKLEARIEEPEGVDQKQAPGRKRQRVQEITVPIEVHREKESAGHGGGADDRRLPFSQGTE